MSFLRSYRIKAGGVDISSAGQLSPLQVEFSCNASITSQQDTFQIKIWNLSESNRRALKEEFEKVELYAGYEQGTSVALIAKGELRSVFTERQDVNMVTTINAGSGDEGCQKGKCNKTMEKNATVKKLIQECAKGMKGVKVGQIKGCDIKADKTHKTLVGNSKRQLDKLAKRAGFDWFIELQELKGLKKTEKFSGTTTASVDTGMIGSPRESIKGVSVDTLLNPSVRIGTTLKIQSKDVNRSYKIVSYSHKGSFYGSGGTWTTTIVGESEDKGNKCGSS